MYIIIGASGFIGRHLYSYCRKCGIDVLGTYFTHAYNKEWIPFDLRSFDLEQTCHKYLVGQKPKAVIICSANASIDSCKSDENASQELNVEGTKRVIAQADAMGTKCVFLSSEAVFDGKKGMYEEEDVPNPITLYGRQKLEIEQHMFQKLENPLIVRISRAVGSSFGEKDIFHEFYEKIMRGEEIICLKNQSFCLTEVNDIVQGLIKAIEMNISGLYHMSSNNYITRYELANLYAERIFGGYRKIFEKNYEEIHFLDNRHIYGGLNGNKLAHLLGMEYTDLEEIMDKYAYTYERKSDE